MWMQYVLVVMLVVVLVGVEEVVVGGVVAAAAVGVGDLFRCSVDTYACWLLHKNTLQHPQLRYNLYIYIYAAMPIDGDAIHVQVVFAFFAFLDFFLELEVDELELEGFAGAAFSVWLSCPATQPDGETCCKEWNQEEVRQSR